jgi:quercetin dioxygenase-like cupin family protein
MTGGPMTTEAGEARWWADGLAVIKLTAEDSSGVLSIIEVTEPPNAAAPLHVHHAEDETFYVLDGEVTFELGAERCTAAPGDVVFGPRGVPHRYDVGADGARMLFVLTPGGFEAVVRAMSVPATEPRLPGKMHEPPDPEAAWAAARAHRVEVLDA